MAPASGLTWVRCSCPPSGSANRLDRGGLIDERQAGADNHKSSVWRVAGAHRVRDQIGAQSGSPSRRRLAGAATALTARSTTARAASPASSRLARASRSPQSSSIALVRGERTQELGDARSPRPSCWWGPPRRRCAHCRRLARAQAVRRRRVAAPSASARSVAPMMRAMSSALRLPRVP